MAATSNQKSNFTAKAAATSPGVDKSSVFSMDFATPRHNLSNDQLSYCSKALKSLRKKFSSEQTIQLEYKKLQAYGSEESLDKSRCTVALDSLNYSKNRYPKHVLPFDDNRVILEQRTDNGHSTTGYINASFLKTSESVTQFIATQGPLSHTVEDFWEMILQHRCPVIVMLTKLVDGKNSVKCDHYFHAEDGAKQFGNILISTKWIQKTADSPLIWRCIEVKHKESKEPPFSVLHVQYPEWPDHGVPEGTLAVREIFKRISLVPPSLGPIVVHCSAGIGRTGTFCAIHNTIQRVVIGDMTALDLVSTITTFRSQRNGMAEKLEQFRYCYEAIIDELEDLAPNGQQVVVA